MLLVRATATLLLLLPMSLLLLVGCPGYLDDPESFGRGCVDAGCFETAHTSTVPDAILIPRCGFQPCHGGPSPQAHLNLSTADHIQDLISKTSSSANCTGNVLIVPGDPASSLLYTKVDEPTCGSKMPPGIDLSNEELDALWIFIANLGQPR